MTALPSLFISHGSPMHAVEPGRAGEVWRAIGAALPRPRALLVVSAHWECDRPTLGGAARPETIHDFYGFPEPLYRLRYPAPGDPALAAEAMALLGAAGLEAEIDAARGLDHGAWAPLLYMYAGADVPVLQLSVQTALGTRHHLALGRALAPLAARGVLLVGSGHMTHNLGDRMARDSTAALPYVLEFERWIDERIGARDLEALAEYRARAPHARRAHPSEEHFLPLFFALGAAPEGYRAERFLPEVYAGALAMDAYLFHPAAAARH